MKLRNGQMVWRLLHLLFHLILNTVSSFDAHHNPYYSGCLQAKLEDWHILRTCNSDDPPEAIGILCQAPRFDNYLEIRTQTRDWDSVLILSWLTQIILSELLGVPTTIENGPNHSQALNFYAPKSPVTLEYSTEQNFEALGTPTELPNGDCQLASKGTNGEMGEYEYQTCAHFNPEHWTTDQPLFQDMVLANKVEPSLAVGILGKDSWFITKFTAAADPTLDSYHGLVGEANRRKLAQAFLRPTTWLQYCQEVSQNNCSIPNTVAKRAPQNDEEAQRMFYEGEFTGHFRNTTQNDCDANPTNCTGHIANFPCFWQSRMSATLYHLDIALSNTDGPGDFGAYTKQQQMDMWDAANATRSNLLMIWWTPEPLYHRYLGTDAEMQQVQLPPATTECMEARWDSSDACSDNLMVRVGEGTTIAVCDEPPLLLQKAVTGNLFALTEQYEGAVQSPAYDMLRRFHLSDHQLGEIFRLWQIKASPRDAVCQWAADNMQFIKGFVPNSYPRVAEEVQESIFSHVMIGLSALTTLLVLLFSWQVYAYRKRKSLEYAQIGFLWLLLSGALLVGIGSILNSLPATNVKCIATIWFINIGFTLELVPLIVKVAAINQMMSAARRMVRITIPQEQLFGAVAVILCLCTVFLVVWTVVDPPHKAPEYSLTEETTDNGETIVELKFFCQGNSDVWQYIAVGWNTVLLICASVLAFQNRHTVQAFNESGNLLFLIASHFLCVLIRCGTFMMSDVFKETMLIQVRSLIYCVDTIATLFIYFLPKLTAKAEVSGSISFTTSHHLTSRPVHLGSFVIGGLDDISVSSPFTISADSKRDGITHNAASKPLDTLLEVDLASKCEPSRGTFASKTESQAAAVEPA